MNVISNVWIFDFSITLPIIDLAVTKSGYALRSLFKYARRFMSYLDFVINIFGSEKFLDYRRSGWVSSNHLGKHPDWNFLFKLKVFLERITENSDGGVYITSSEFEYVSIFQFLDYPCDSIPNDSVVNFIQRFVCLFFSSYIFLWNFCIKHFSWLLIYYLLLFNLF